MTVLCWNTTWISVHSSDYNFFIFLLHLRVFFNRGLKNNNNVLVKLDFIKAFNSLHRREMLLSVHSRFPELYTVSCFLRSFHCFLPVQWTRLVLQ